ncbi:MAG: hypothetical protein HC915_02295, partial [Anaerolineae bacterium]|nr:hypothetical protein [Anaerolineae bacterium]
ATPTPSPERLAVGTPLATGTVEDFTPTPGNDGTPIRFTAEPEGANVGTPIPGGAADATEVVQVTTPQANVTAQSVGGSPAPFATVTPLPTIAPIGAANPPNFSAIPGTALVANPNASVVEVGSAAVGNVVFDVSSAGQVGYFGLDGLLYVNNQVVNFAPSGALPPDQRIRDMEWSPGGGVLAFVAETPVQNDFAGIWLYDTSSGAPDKSSAIAIQLWSGSIGRPMVCTSC